MFDFRRLKLGERRAANPSTRSGGRMSGGPFLGEILREDRWTHLPRQ